MADEHRIANIQVARGPIPIEFRVIRKWKPFANGTKIAYLLVDKHKMIEETHDVQLANVITLMNCYSLEVYNSIGAPGMYRVALHPAAIRIHSETPFIPIHDDLGIGTTYYNFMPYESLTTRVNVNRLLTDFIGMIYSIQFGEQGRRTPAIRLNLEDHRYHTRHPAADPNDISSQKIQVEGGPSEKNRTTIGQLLEKTLAQHRGITYTCDAVFAGFAPGQSWRYPTCPVCTLTMDAQDGGYVCTKDREQEPNYKYCVKGDLSDGTEKVSVTIFDQPIAALLGVSCNDMVRVHGNLDPMKIPQPMEVLKNQQKIYQLNNVTRDFNDNLRFAVNRIYRAEVGEKRRYEASSSSGEATPKKVTTAHTDAVQTGSPLATTKLAETAAATPDILKNKIKGPVSSTPPETIASVSGSEASQGKSPMLSSSRRPPAKQLFKEKDGTPAHTAGED
ncbi:hypothetical protein SSX86_024248 [Deinandra increscens subsp. villosa]|uniref:Replication factor A C-terminal domain-containing protein n=1 Tax=Deinandra increscens subsp. villosa TaxID=3103831 RepID=A0AAP0CHE7_9ASTR